MTLSYRDGVPADAAVVHATYRESFDAIFGHLYSPENFDAYISTQGPDAFAAQLADPAYPFRLAEDDGRLIGFAKLGPPSLPYDPAGRRCIELRQLYLLDAAKGTGVANTLMDWVLAEGRRRGATELWLSVFSGNPRARRFYQRWGFDEVGRFDFMVGTHADDEYLCQLVL